MIRPPPRSPLFPYPPLSRSPEAATTPAAGTCRIRRFANVPRVLNEPACWSNSSLKRKREASMRSEEHTSELQSHLNLVCRLLLEKKKINASRHPLYSQRYRH